MRSKWPVDLLMLIASIAALASGTPDRAFASGDKDLGEYLSSECVTCHQLSGHYDGIPAIVGWPNDSFIEIMNEYRHKKRANPIMQTIARRFSAEEIEALAAYFGSLKEQQQSK